MLLNVKPSLNIKFVVMTKHNTSLRLMPVRAHYCNHSVEHKVVTVFTCADALLSLPINIGQTLYGLLNHFSMSKVLY